MMAMRLCGVTKNIRIDCGFNVASVRLAEDLAMADILTGGQVIFGVGREYLTALRRLRLFTKGRPVPIESEPRQVEYRDPTGRWVDGPCRRPRPVFLDVAM
jgi:alkanesulfonate monooxygenase SsuD/methylene tetrahydromethanopterin reductase-like flavin-dependent oxidoreductase (luciferase family)